MNAQDMGVIRRSTLAGIAFFFTVAGLALASAALVNGVTLSDKKNPGEQLSSSAWWRMVDSILELDARTAPLSTTAGNVKSTGYLQGKQAAFSAYATASSPAGPSTAIVFGWITTNVGNNYDATTGKFTAPVSGLYFVTARWLTNVGTDLQLRIHVNWAAVPGLTAYASGIAGWYASQSISGVIQLNAWDYVTVGNLSGNTMHGWPNYNSWFSMFLIGN